MEGDLSLSVSGCTLLSFLWHEKACGTSFRSGEQQEDSRPEGRGCFSFAVKRGRQDWAFLPIFDDYRWTMNGRFDIFFS